MNEREAGQRRTVERARRGAMSAGAGIGAWAIVISAGVAGCTSDSAFEATQELRRSVVASARRELEPAEAQPEPRRLMDEAGVSELGFDEDRLRELREMAGESSYGDELPSLGEDLLGAMSIDGFRISLRQAVTTAVENNLAVQSSRLGPAISGAEVLAAQAAFDWTFFSNFNWNSVDQPTTVPVINGFPVGVGANTQQTVGYETGVRRPLITGGTFEASFGQTYTDDTTPGADFFPDPSNRVFVDLEIRQPLLRGFGSDVALATVRLTRNAERGAIQTLRQQLIDTITSVELAYWDLDAAYRELRVRQRLLERGLETRDVLAARRDFDVRPAEFSDAVARVESRRADLIVAQNEVRLASDQLKALINDSQLTVGTETVLLPVERPVRAGIEFSLFDSLVSALANRPDIARAILDIDDASIRQVVADNARLPRLDLAFSTRFNGVDRGVMNALDDITDTQFVDLAVGLEFEQPIGNRAAEATFRAAQLRRMQGVIDYRGVVQESVREVKAALRGIQTNYRLIQQTEVSRLAATENLRTLEVQEETVQSLTPDFLDLKFSRQEALASAEIAEINALRDYNTALAEYYAAMGTTLLRNRIDLVVPDFPGNADDGRLFPRFGRRAR